MKDYISAIWALWSFSDSCVIFSYSQLVIEDGDGLSHFVSEVDSGLHALDHSEDVDIGSVDVFEDDRGTGFGLHQVLNFVADNTGEGDSDGVFRAGDS